MPMAEELQKRWVVPCSGLRELINQSRSQNRAFRKRVNRGAAAVDSFFCTLKHKHLLVNTSKQKNEPEKKQNMGSLNVTESFFKDFFVSVYASLQPTRASVACDKHFLFLLI